jgi:hypothetical protein
VRVPGVCAWPVVGAPDLQAIAAYNSGPRPPGCWAHESRRRLVRIVPPVPGLYNCFTHSACVCNDMISATNRVLGVTPLPSRSGVAQLRCVARTLARRCGIQGPWTRDQVFANMTASRRKRYERAREELERGGLVRRHGRISSFVKSEKFDPLAKVNPDPRMIQARTPEYGLEIARFLKPIEHCFYQMRGPTGLRMVAKGLNQVHRAQLLARKMAQFSRCVVFSLDCSRWDKHVVRQVLEVEHAFYLRLLPDPLFQRMLSWQFDNQCVTQNGVKYKVDAGRMSGDMNTALGNCLLMITMVHAAMRQLAIAKWDLLDDGDDCLVLCEEGDFILLESSLPAAFLAFGQELKVENVARDIRDVTFCQSRVVVLPSGPRFVRDWRRVLSQAACGCKHWSNPSMVRPMLTAVGLCELACARGVPILQAFALALVRNGQGLLPRVLDLDSGVMLRTKYELGGVPTLEALRALKPVDVTSETRCEFARTWGVRVEEQLHVEMILSQWVVSTVVARDFAEERDASWHDRTALENMIPVI